MDNPDISAVLNSNQKEAIGDLREKINLCQQLLAPKENVTGSTIPVKVLENLESDASYGFLASTYGGLRLSESTGNLLASILSEECPEECLPGDITFCPPEWDNLSQVTKVKMAETLSLKNLERWDFNILEVVKNVDRGSVLTLVSWAIIASPESQKVMMSSIGKEYEEEEWGGYNFFMSLNVDHKTLVSFLRSLESQYSIKGSYHTNIHAADVTQTLHCMIRMGSGELKNSMSRLDMYSMLLAAAAHDVGHPGTNNLYQINAQTNLAITYNDKSPLESMHASKASQLIKQAGLLVNFSSEQRFSVRDRMISAILATDMSSHFNSVSYMEEFISQFENNDANWHDSVTSNDSGAVQHIMNFMIHLADISNPTKMRSLSTYWADQTLTEFFAQGDLEREANLPISPLCDRKTTDLAASQRDFIQFVVLPSFKVLGRLFPSIGDEVLPRIDENLAYWKSRCVSSQND